MKKTADDGSGSERKRRYRAGLRGEMLAAAWLRLKGYRVLAKRYRTPVGEIDLVLRRRDVVVFAEVKAHRAGGAEAVSARQRNRIGRCAEWILARDPSLAAAAEYRFDVVLIRPWAPPVHIVDAWRAGG